VRGVFRGVLWLLRATVGPGDDGGVPSHELCGGRVRVALRRLTKPREMYGLRGIPLLLCLRRVRRLQNGCEVNAQRIWWHVDVVISFFTRTLMNATIFNGVHPSEPFASFPLKYHMWSTKSMSIDD